MIWRRSPKPLNLVDASAVHREHPRTFSVPRQVVRESLRSGDVVKLLFAVVPPVGGVEVERMWVRVDKKEGGRYSGRLANNPAYRRDLKAGHQIEFGPEHVAAREAEPGDPLYTDPEAFAVVSRRVWDSDSWPSRVERHDIPDATFSGWFVLAGDEDADYRADRANFLPVPQGALFHRFQVLDSALEGPVNTVMEWDDSAAEYRAAT